MTDLTLEDLTKRELILLIKDTHGIGYTQADMVWAKWLRNGEQEAELSKRSIHERDTHKAIAQTARLQRFHRTGKNLYDLHRKLRGQAPLYRSAK